MGSISVRLLSVGADGGGYTSLCSNKDAISLSKKGEP